MCGPSSLATQEKPELQIKEFICCLELLVLFFQEKRTRKIKESTGHDLETNLQPCPPEASGASVS
jgi:hypothetical protein